MRHLHVGVGNDLNCEFLPHSKYEKWRYDEKPKEIFLTVIFDEEHTGNFFLLYFSKKQKQSELS